MKIIDHLFQVGGDALSAPGDAAVYLAAFEDSAALIDAGCGHGHTRIIDNISRCIAPSAAIKYLFITHCHYDHIGGADAFRKHYGCKIVAHEHDARFIEAGNNEVTAAAWYGACLEPFSVDYKIKGDSELFQLGSSTIQALHCPGHSPGSVVYLAEINGEKVLFGQDVHGPLHPSLLSNREDYIMSLTRLADLEADILCEGHYGVIKGKEEVRRFIQSFIR